MARRTAYFVDGENTVARYQAMLEKGWVPHQATVHEPDVFVWHSERLIGNDRDDVLVRVSY